MKRKINRLLSCILLICFLLTGCQINDHVDSQITDLPHKLQIGLSFDSFVIERWLRDRDVFVSEAKELGAEVNVQNANGDVDEQISQIEYFIKKRMDVIVVVAGDRQKLTNVMLKAREAGIKTVCYDRLIESSGCDLYISFDNQAVGRLMAEDMVRRLPNGGDIFLIMGSPADNNVHLVRQGIQEVLNKSQVNVVYEEYCEGWLAEHALNYVEEGLNKHPNIDGIICGNDDLAGQTFRALSQARLAGKVILSGQDGDLAACQRIVEGTQSMTVYKSIENQARIAAAYAVKLGKGESISDIKATIYDGVYDVPYLELEPTAITDDNIDDKIINAGVYTRNDVYLNVD